MYASSVMMTSVVYEIHSFKQILSKNSIILTNNTQNLKIELFTELKIRTAIFIPCKNLGKYRNIRYLQKIENASEYSKLSTHKSNKKNQESHYFFSSLRCNFFHFKVCLWIMLLIKDIVIVGGNMIKKVAFQRRRFLLYFMRL